jgi:hypothetical protein
MTDDLTDVDPIPQTAIDALTPRAELDAWSQLVPVQPENPDNATVPIALTVGRRPLQSPGSRAPRRAAAVTGLDAGQRSNWLLTGPRNVGGRTRAFAIDPANPATMYAGLAAGGVWKTTDRGETWAPSWRDDASQSIGGISICQTVPATVWVATGEHLSQILGTGIYVSNDNGATWGPANAAIPGNGQAVTFDAIAAHPTNIQRCWAVGATGIYRTNDAGVTWETVLSGVPYSDVAYAAGPAGLVVFLVRAVSTLGEATVLRIDNPDAALAAVQASVANPASTSNPIAAGPPPPPAAPLANWPARGKIAVCAGTPTVAYVRFAQQGTNQNGGGHAGLFRTHAAPNNAQAATGSAIQWDAIAPAGHASFQAEFFGGYSMALGVDPANAAQIATAMSNVQVSQNATVAAPTFKQAMAQELFPVLDAAQHSDNHVSVFGPPPPGSPGGTPPTLWIANDGGIVRSDDWATGAGYTPNVTFLPLPDGAVSWRKSYGITGTQMYSLAQSPLSPTAFGCGLQDNGVMMTAGGPTWRFLISGDGGFLAFDPDDPYKLLATWQSEVDEVLFPGRLEGAFPPPGTSAGSGLWPRFLAQGFLATDPPLFVGDTAHHLLKGDRVLNARVNRLYGSTATNGDAWRVEPVGRGVEIHLAMPANTLALLRVLPSTAGPVLGLPPQVALAQSGAQATTLRIRLLLPGPYALQDGQQLNLQVTLSPVGGPPAAPVALPPIVFNRPPAKRGVPWTPAEVAAAIVGPGVRALPCFWPRPNAVELATTAVGAAAQITLAGNALQPLVAGGLSPLGQLGRTIAGAANRTASVTIFAPNVGVDTTSTMAGKAGSQLSIAIGGGSAKTITFDATTFSDLAWIHAGELQRALASALDGQPVTVTAFTVTKSLLFQATSPAGLTLGGTAATGLAGGGTPGPGLNLVGPPPPAFNFAYAWPVPGNTFNLAPGVNPQTLTINDGAAKPTLTFNQGANPLRAITAEEVQAIIQNHFTANAVAATCDIQYFAGGGFPSEIVYATAHPDTAWVGSTDGTLYKTTNDGGQWDTIADPQMFALDRTVEAIAIHPTNPDTVYVGLEGRPTSGPEDSTPLTKPGLIFKTTNGGDSWSHVGGDVKSTDGGLLGAYALRIDTGAPDTVFAATEVGVFRTTNGGSSWQPFNEGLPAGLVRDLDFVPQRRVLRAGIWGRGTYERRVGDASAKDVHLYVRMSELDDGSVRPAPRGPDLRSPQPRSVAATSSPDIKVSRDIPPSFAGAITLDGAAFDLDVVHEPLASGNSFIYVQLANRGGFGGSNPRVMVLWADVSAGIPPLPADFFTTLRAGALSDPEGDWHVVHDTLRPNVVPVVASAEPGRPVVQQLPFAWPADIATHRRVGLLLLVECDEDHLTSTTLNVDDLLASEPKAAFRETGTVRDRDDQTILLRGTRAAQFTVSAPPAPLVGGTAILAAPGLPVGPVTSLLGAAQPGPGFNLPPVGANVRALTFSTPPQIVTITFSAAAGIANLAAATQAEVENVITRALVAAGAPVAVNAGGGGTVQLRGGAGSLFAVTGGAAAPSLGLAVGAPVGVLVTGAAPFNLSAGAPQILTLSVTNRAVVHFARSPDFDPTVAQPARAVRRVLNRAFAAANLPVRAVVPRVDLWIRRSITDIDGLPSPVAGHGLADIVAAPAAVAAANQPALFDLVTVHGPDVLHAAVDNLLYTRVSNLGTADLATADSRHRLYQIAITASPITVTQIGAAVGIQQAVAAGTSTIVEAHWNPGAASPGDRFFVLAVADDSTNNPLLKGGAAFDASATFASVDELDLFCTVNPGAAYRMFVVGA